MFADKRDAEDLMAHLALAAHIAAGLFPQTSNRLTDTLYRADWRADATFGKRRLIARVLSYLRIKQVRLDCARFCIARPRRHARQSNVRYAGDSEVAPVVATADTVAAAATLASHRLPMPS